MRINPAAGIDLNVADHRDAVVGAAAAMNGGVLGANADLAAENLRLLREMLQRLERIALERQQQAAGLPPPQVPIPVGRVVQQAPPALPALPALQGRPALPARPLQQSLRPEARQALPAGPVQQARRPEDRPQGPKQPIRPPEQWFFLF